MPAHTKASPAFSERYALLRLRCVREDTDAVTERLLQCAWYDLLFDTADLRTQQGHAIKVRSPGWWNQGEGPDFRGAQIEFNGVLHNGDVEVHLDHAGWNAHRHQHDPRYDNVILHVVLHAPAEKFSSPRTRAGREIATLALAPRLGPDWMQRAAQRDDTDTPALPPQTMGRCAALLPQQGTQAIEKFLLLAGEWRMLNKARALRRRIEAAGTDQAIYEALLYACGFSRFKHQFLTLARHLPYDRARQLALEDPHLLETAFFAIAALLPQDWPENTPKPPHLTRLHSLQRDRLPGLRPLPLEWPRGGVRPINFPERRIAGVARLIARTAQDGLAHTLDRLWRSDFRNVQRRRAFEELFPRAMGFWANRCTWNSNPLPRPAAPIGPTRVRSIIGNVFIPAELALARLRRDRAREECVADFYRALPKEADNHIVKIMLPRVLQDAKTLRINFQMQQGLLQMHQDWCEPNPSCRNCSVFRYLTLEDLER